METSPTAENNNFDRELTVSVFDYLADAYNAGRLAMDELVEAYHAVGEDITRQDSP